MVLNLVIIMILQKKDLTFNYPIQRIYLKLTQCKINKKTIENLSLLLYLKFNRIFQMLKVNSQMKMNK